MEFYDVIRARRSIRKYKEQDVPRETIDRILEAGRLAPSWCNRQCWRYILISDKATKKALGELLDNPTVDCYISAPYVLVLCADSSDRGFSCGKEYYLVDCGITLAHIVLAATAEGLATCWVGLFPENPVRNLLGIPREVHVVAITPIGYGDEEPKPQERVPRQEIVFEQAWKR